MTVFDHMIFIMYVSPPNHFAKEVPNQSPLNSNEVCSAKKKGVKSPLQLYEMYVL